MKGCAFNRCGECSWAQSTTPKSYSKIQIGGISFAAAVATTAIVMSILLICIQQGCDIPGLNSIASSIDPTWLYVGLSIAAVIDGAILVAAVRSYLNRAPIAPLKESSSDETPKPVPPKASVPPKAQERFTSQFIDTELTQGQKKYASQLSQDLLPNQYRARDYTANYGTVVYALGFFKSTETLFFETNEARNVFLQEKPELYDVEEVAKQMSGASSNIEDKSPEFYLKQECTIGENTVFVLFYKDRNKIETQMKMFHTDAERTAFVAKGKTLKFDVLDCEGEDRYTDAYFDTNFPGYSTHLANYGRTFNNQQYAVFNLSNQSTSVFTLVYNKFDETDTFRYEPRIIHFTSFHTRQDFIRGLSTLYTKPIEGVTEEYPPALEELIFSPAMRESILQKNTYILPGELTYDSDSTKETTIGVPVFYMIENNGGEKSFRFLNTSCSE